MRNDLLEQIVIASGGVVTNKSDRNALLSDWLAAVSAVYVASLDGATQYWQLSDEIPMPTGYSAELSVRVAPECSRIAYLISSELDSTTTSLYFQEQEGEPVGTQGVTFEADADFPSYDNTSHTIRITSLREGGGVRLLGVRFSLGSRFFTGSFENLRIFDSAGNLVNEIPLTNKFQGATQIATVGNVNATMINYTSDVWEPLP